MAQGCLCCSSSLQRPAAVSAAGQDFWIKLFKVREFDFYWKEKSVGNYFAGEIPWRAGGRIWGFSLLRYNRSSAKEGAVMKELLLLAALCTHEPPTTTVATVESVHYRGHVAPRRIEGGAQRKYEVRVSIGI
jgi:hypothetical protein